MKCEICQQADAQTAIVRKNGDEEQELYVCRACAEKERRNRQKKSQRTRKASGSPDLSITVSGGTDEPPPFISAIMDAVSGLVDDLDKAEQEKKTKKAPKLHDFPVSRVESNYRFVGLLHLEGLHLIGEIEAVTRALHALKMELVGVDADGVRAAGHVYRLRYSGPVERARRVAEDLITQERNARVRLFEELPRIFSDALCRALAVLKNCRLLSSGELFDLLSPLRLAALEDMLDGITLAELEELGASCDLSGKDDKLEPSERDRVDAERADRMNARFEDVVLNERAEEKDL